MPDYLMKSVAMRKGTFRPSVRGTIKGRSIAAASTTCRSRSGQPID
jgi:hypothetical protein